MAIQWFPGHMHKARTEMAAVLKGTDLVIEVRDARIPAASANPMLHELLADRPRLCVLSRHDLADPELSRQWIDALQAETVATVPFEPGDTALLKQLRKALRDALPQEVPGERRRVAMVVGIPNVGKSTLINALAGEKVAKTGNEPAVTRRQQDVPLEGHVALRDTPGVLWPRIDNPAAGYRLGVTGAIRETALDHVDVAMYLLEWLALNHAVALETRWPDLASELDAGCASTLGQITPDTPLDAWALPGPLGLQLLEAVGTVLGSISRRGQVDLDRAARSVIMDFRGGRLGRLTLETPAVAELENTAVLHALEQREAQRLKRRSRQNNARKKGR